MNPGHGRASVRLLSLAVLAGPVVATGQDSTRAAPAAPACAIGAAEVRGVVRRLDGASVPAGLAVSIGWNVLQLQGLSVRTERCERAVVTQDGGAFVASGVPSNESLLIIAAGANGDVGVALRHEAGGAGSAPLSVFLPASADVEAAGDPGTGRACRTRGRVLNATGKPVANARVRVAGSDVVRTDAQGAFDAPACGSDGTTFDVRGLDVARGEWWVSLSGVPRYWAVSLDRPMPRLDAVVVTAPRREFADVTGFDQRRRGAWGRFITREDIERRMPMRLQFMLEGLPGVMVGANGQIRMSRNLGLGCAPAIFVDGMFLQGFDLSMIDPLTVYGIEVYRSAADTPPQFLPPGRGACGAVVVWTRRGLDNGSRGR